MATNPSHSNRKKLKQSKSICQIPQDLIIEIVIRLPVKSILKFKCVSKSWLSLISSTQFIRFHFSISSAISTHANEYLNSNVLITPKPSLRPTCNGLKQISLYSSLYDDNPPKRVSDFDFSALDSYNAAAVVDIVNGLVCLLVKGNFVLWNPALRDSKFLPISKVPGKKSLCSMHGFGYDELNDDYKVVLLVSGNVAVYSLLSDSWRMIDFKGDLPRFCSGKYANGNIHWLVGSSPPDWKITCLDMVSEKFGELQLPECGYGVSKTYTEFGVSNDRLFLLWKDLVKTDLWVMDKYGVQESWSKVVSVPVYKLHPFPGLDGYTPQVVCILRNGGIVLSDGWGLTLYQHKCSSRYIGLKREKACLFYMYIESLVSPNR